MKIIPEKAWLFKVDLKNVYWNVKIDPDLRRHLAFEFQGKVFQQHKACPMRQDYSKGSHLHYERNAGKYEGESTKVFGTGYLDDFLFWHESEECLKAQVPKIDNMLRSHGFRINEMKSILSPSQSIDFLG
jgi:hypothetical protein